ncbi:MAG: 30S ribosomal protein S2 [Pseudomonadota bacterium]|nr:30S ribosomal protein S2 [Pseudomonadota bacterium]MEC8996315.1 30S ribosomal protein S2 [Pseudomonadota bacterium]MED5429819.1 30S ribosomal protein S2 [Pseudomonadota bacterium]|tara:strand:- start:17840 stop:18694 length:855 start_codon:yes stop_codon:yes gene_type:complete
MADISIKEMFEAGVHFGHQSKYWNPKMQPYIYTTHKKLHIINLEKTADSFTKALGFITELAAKNSKILFVGTKRAAKEIIMKYAKEAKMPYVNNRWLGGMLTNFNTVKKSISKLDNLKKQLDLEHTNNLTKKESLKIKKLIVKLNKNLEGIKDLDKTPDALFVVDTRYERIAIQEANKLNIPVIALVDSNNSYEGVDYMIPANDDSMKSIELFIRLISEKIANTTKNIVKTPIKSNVTDKNNANKKSVRKKQVVKVDAKKNQSTAHKKKPQKKIVKAETEEKKK